MSGGIYLRDGDGLVRMVEQPYESEDVLQRLIEEHPDLLAGEQDGEGGSRWLLIAREAALASEPDGAGRWSVDHLFVDATGIPTIVEVKRSSDTRIRREVVGQMLDYAANAVSYWELPRLRTTFEAGPPILEIEPTDRLAAFLGPDADPDAFWEDVAVNLKAGRVRLVFVSDEIPSELRRIVEFLYEQMSPAQVFAIEVKQYRDESGRHQILVPRLIGQTEAARQSKPSSPGRTWDAESFMESVKSQRPEAEAAVAAKLIEWARQHQDPPLVLAFGKGRTTASVQPGAKTDDAYVFPFQLYPEGFLYINFGTMITAPYPPFDRDEKRRALRDLLEEIDGAQIPEDRLTKFPRIDLAQLIPPAAFNRFVEAMEWVIEEAKNSGFGIGNLSDYVREIDASRPAA